MKFTNTLILCFTKLIQCDYQHCYSYYCPRYAGLRRTWRYASGGAAESGIQEFRDLGFTQIFLCRSVVYQNPLPKAIRGPKSNYIGAPRLYGIGLRVDGVGSSENCVGSAWNAR